MDSWGQSVSDDHLSSLVGEERIRVRMDGSEFVMRIPVPWIHEAAILSGKCVAVGLSLWFRFGIDKTPRVKLTRALLRKFGVDRHAGKRALAKLESAGLVTVERANGRSPIVTLCQLTSRTGPNA